MHGDRHRGGRAPNHSLYSSILLESLDGIQVWFGVSQVVSLKYMFQLYLLGTYDWQASARVHVLCAVNVSEYFPYWI